MGIDEEGDEGGREWGEADRASSSAIPRSRAGTRILLDSLVAARTRPPFESSRAPERKSMNQRMMDRSWA